VEAEVHIATLAAMTRRKVTDRLGRLGAEALSEDELLALVAGRTSTGLTAQRSLTRLARTSITELQGAGLGPAPAAALCAAFELGRRVAQATAPVGTEVRSAAAAFEYLQPRIAHLPHEVFVVVLLDVRLRVLRDVRVAQGNGWSCAVQPRDALAPAVTEGAAAVVFAHNHPSGDTSPSREDVDLTSRLVAAADILGIRAVDHLVVTATGFASLKELGLFGTSRASLAVAEQGGR
jgi:DNA repair protein RadC